MSALFIPKGLNALANKQPTMQILLHSKFGFSWSTSLKVMAKKLFWTQIKFLVITFMPVDRIIANFEHGKISMVGGLFKVVLH